MGNSVKGTVFKLNINMTPNGVSNLDSIDWEAEVYTKGGGKRQTITKADAIRIDDDNYVIAVDSAIGGSGAYFLTFTAKIHDEQCQNSIRIEKVTVPTGVVIDAQ